MSRCFAYPPPGYSTLKDSIQLQRGIEKVKAERKKEKKREKKDKKREKGEKKKPDGSDFCHGEEGKLNDKKILKRDREGLKGCSTEKRRENVAEQLERSDITEEHEQPVSSQNACYSCDSTQNSNKRPWHSPPLDGSHSHGNIIRIRLPLQKAKESVALASEVPSSSISGGIVSPAQPDYGAVAHGPSREELGSTSRVTGIIDLQGVTHRPGKEPSCSASVRTTSLAQDNKQNASVVPGKEPSSSASARTTTLARGNMQNTSVRPGKDPSWSASRTTSLARDKTQNTSVRPGKEPSCSASVRTTSLGRDNIQNTSVRPGKELRTTSLAQDNIPNASVRHGKEPSCSASARTASLARDNMQNKNTSVRPGKEPSCLVSARTTSLARDKMQNTSLTPGKELSCTASARTTSLARDNVQNASVRPAKELSCTASARTTSLARDNMQNTSVRPCKEPRTTTLARDNMQNTSVRPCKEPRTTSLAQDNMQNTSGIMSFGNGMKKEKSPYKDLFEIPLPPLQSYQAEFDDQEWLFGRKLQDKQRDERCTASSYVSSCATSALWPCAQYLPEADIYALPYTIPY